MKDKGQPILFPEVAAPHMAEWLIAIGPTSGDQSIGWQDLVAWQSITGIELDPWEARTLRTMSLLFVNQRHEAKKPECPAPYAGTEETIVSNRDRVAAQIKAAFSGLKKKQ